MTVSNTPILVLNTVNQRTSFARKLEYPKKMVFVLFILKLLGFYLLYTNSGKTTYVLLNWEQSIRKQKKFASGSGGFLLGITLAGFMLLFGVAGGLFYDLTCLMLIASLCILLRPLMTKEQSKTHSHAGK